MMLGYMSLAHMNMRLLNACSRDLGKLLASPKLGETWTPHTLRPTPPGVGTQADQWHLGTTANQGVQEGTTDGVVAWHSKAKVHMGADAGMQLYHHLW